MRGVRSIAPGLYRDGDGRGPAWEALLEREIGALARLPRGPQRRRRTRAQPAPLHRRPATRRRRRQPPPAAARRPRRAPGSQALRLQSVFAVGMVHFLQLPYFIAWSLQSRDRASQERLRRHFLSMGPSDPKIAVFTDTVDEVDGVSVSLRRLAEAAAERGLALEVITSTSAPTGRRDGALNFQANAWRPPARRRRPSPRRAPHRRRARLPRGERLHGHPREHRRRRRPGRPAGRQAAAPADHGRLAASRRRPRRRYVTWFSSMLDEVFAPSRAAARDLVARGLDPRRVRVLPAAVDGDSHPRQPRRAVAAARAGATRRRSGTPCPGGPRPGVPARRV